MTFLAMLRSAGDARGWRRPEVLLLLMAAAMPLAQHTWLALLNNYAVERIGFDGADIGLLQSIREIPGFLAFTFVWLLFVLREQTIALVSLLLLGAGVAAAGVFPSYWGLMATTLILSIGFHYYETASQSLVLQWAAKSEAPIVIGRMLSAMSFAALLAYGLTWLVVQFTEIDMRAIFAAGGLATIAIAVAAWIAFPRFPAKTEQRKSLVLRRRYWLFYGLALLRGARRQIFIVFAVFLLVKEFGWPVEAMVFLFLINHAVNTLAAPQIGRFIAHFGERNSLTIEYSGLIAVFVGYAITGNVWVAAALYVADHIFFAMSPAINTYFQKIADPADIAPSAAVAFTINHIVAVIVPVGFGVLWDQMGHAVVFFAGAGLAAASLVLARLVPRDPSDGNETVLARPAVAPAAAE